MNSSEPFIRRPVATFLLSLGLLLSGIIAYRFLPVASLPQVDIPTLVVFATRPGADPAAMASSVAAPIERRLGEISGVSELTSLSATGSTSIIVQFDVERNLDDAGKDVQAALNAALTDLPPDLPTRPYFRKFNPADAPILTLALTSDTLPLGKIYDVADSILAQRLSQIDGVSQVEVNGSEQPAVRVMLNPAALAAAGLSGQDVTTAINAANVTGPTGGFEGPDRAETIGTNGQLTTAKDYQALVLKRAGNAVVTLADVATVVNASANRRLAAWSGTRPAILLMIHKSADANVIQTADHVREILPLLRSWMPPDIQLSIVSDRTTTIRAGLHDVDATLLITIALVLLVVLLFMRRLVPTIAAGVTVPLSIAGSLAAMWCFGFTLDNFSLMALTISVGFVIDDAIVMIENIANHAERGETPMNAALNGARQIGFTVLSISLSLVAVFIPLLFMGGIVGRLFHEFATTLTMAIAVSAIVSLTMTPMLCAHFMRHRPVAPRWHRIDAAVEEGFAISLACYAASLDWALRRRALMVLATFGAAALTVWLYIIIPKGLLPTQDTGQIDGTTICDPSVSFQAMSAHQREVVDVLLRDPAVASVGSLVGIGSGFDTLNRGTLIIALKPRAERGVSSEQVIARLRPALASLSGVQTVLESTQDLRGGGREGPPNQFLLLDADLDELRLWTGRLEEKLRGTEGITDVGSDLDRAGPQVNLVIDRKAAARLGVSVAAIDAALGNAFAQRQGSVIYTDRNQYRVVIELDPALQTAPASLDRLYVGATATANGVTSLGANGSSSANTASLTPGAAGANHAANGTGVTTGTGSALGGKQVPLAAIARFERGVAPLGVRHQGQTPAATIFYNLAPGVAPSEGLQRVQQAAADLQMAAGVRSQFAGNAKFLEESLRTQPMLIGAAFLSIYMVLGVLYESLTQPLTIISTLPSAGLGALLALRLTHTELSVVSIIGILLLMGIVKKNAIMLVDFALEQERRHGRTPAEAIYAACLVRFRPIMMTTLAALLGALPLALSFGTGAELRQPLGIAIAGGLLVSQVLTLYTTPVIYLALQFRRRHPTPSGITVGSP